MSEQVVNIGQIAAIWIASTPPENVKLIWYDTASQVHCVYDSYIGDWKPLDPQIITTTSINTLRSEAVQSGLPIGKFYKLEDTQTLAISITTTKIWYVDIHGNYVVDDLASSAQYYLNSTNLYIDGETGVWDVDSGHLNFSFTEQNTASELDTDKDYVVMRHNVGNGVWSWIKSKISTFISSVSGNSLSWNNGIYFNFSSAINAIKNVAGGIVGKDEYESDKAALQQSIQNTALNNQSYAAAANSYTDSKVTDEEIYDKELPTTLTVPSVPPTTPSVGAKLITILGQVYGWIANLKHGNSVMLDQGLNSNGVDGNINAADNVVSAFNKVIGWIKKLQLANNINVGTGFDPNGTEGDFSTEDSVQDSLEKLIWKTKHIAINQENWNAATGFNWIIRNNVLYLNLSMNFYDVSYSYQKCSKAGDGSYLKFNDDFLTYANLIFEKIPWYRTEVSQATDRCVRQKWIYIKPAFCTYVNVVTSGAGGLTFQGVPISEFLSFNLCFEETSVNSTGEVLSNWCGIGFRFISGSWIYADTTGSSQTPSLSKAGSEHYSYGTTATVRIDFNETIQIPI